MDIFFNGGYESHGLDCLSPSQLHLPSLYLTLPSFGQVIFHISLYLFASLCCHIDVPFAWTALPHFLLAVKSPFTVLESSCSLQLWASLCHSVRQCKTVLIFTSWLGRASLSTRGNSSRAFSGFFWAWTQPWYVKAPSLWCFLDSHEHVRGFQSLYSSKHLILQSFLPVF